MLYKGGKAMNILKYEIKSNRKVFIFWSLGLLFFLFAGMAKYTGISEAQGVDLNAMMEQFPKIMLAVFGINGLDMGTLDGYYGILVYYSFIFASIYSISLGINAVTREAIDKTYEFIFTKPRKHNFVLAMKLLAGFIYLTLFNLLNFLFSIGAISTLKEKEDINMTVALFCAIIYLVSIVFFCMAVFVAVWSKNSEKGSLYGYFIFLTSFLIGIASDMFENNNVIRVFSPFKYFLPSDIIKHDISVGHIVLCLALIIITLSGAFKLFARKDLVTK